MITTDLEELLAGSGVPTPALDCGSATIPAMIGALRPDLARFVREVLAGKPPARAASRTWPQDNAHDAELAAHTALERPEIRAILTAYEIEAPCPACGEPRCHAEAFGRFFWEACEPCARRALRERMKAWGGRMMQQVGATHWGQQVELVAPLKRRC